MLCSAGFFCLCCRFPSSRPPPPPQRRISFGQIIFQMAALFLMLPSLGMLLLLTHREISATQQRIAREIEDKALVTAQIVARWTANHVRAARIIAELGTSSPLQPSAELQEKIERIHALFPEFHNVFLGDASGTTIAFHPPVNERGQSTIGISFADRTWFKELRNSLNPTISDVFLGRGGIFVPIFSISVPVVRDGRLSHFGLGAINLQHMQNMLALASGGQDFLRYTIIDRNGKVVVSTDRTRAPLAPASGNEGGGGQVLTVSEAVSLIVPEARKNISVMEAWKDAFYLATAPIPGTPWLLRLEQSLAPLQHHYYSSAIWGLSGVAILFGVMLALAQMLSRRLSAPILFLASVSNNLPTKIEKQERIEWPRSNIAELSELIDNFRQASGSIEQHLARANAARMNLEKTVQERTAELLHERRRLDQIIEGTNVGTWEWNVQTGETTFNERWAEFLGYRLAELEPVSIQTWIEHVHPDDIGISEALLEKHFSGTLSYYECECRMRHRDGHWIWVLDRGKVATWTEDGKPLLMSGTHADITQRKNAELQLQEKTQQLEALTAELEQRVRSEVALRIKGEQLLVQQSKLAAMGEMLGAISHQWRQPLNALGIIIQNIREAYTFGELHQEYLDTSTRKAMSQIQHMSRTIDDFRNFFRPDKEKRNFDPMAAVGEVLGLISAQLSANAISYRLTCHTHGKIYESEAECVACEAMTASGYRNEFQHVILNLLNNARDAIMALREATPAPARQPGRIDLDFHHSASNIVIEVADNGGGIAEEIMDRIFEPYFTTRDQAKGTGLGLYMSKLIMEHMGGTLSVRNGEEGAVFTVALPLAEQAATSGR